MAECMTVITEIPG